MKWNYFQVQADLKMQFIAYGCSQETQALAAPVALAALAFAFAHARRRVSLLARRFALWTVGVLLLGFCVLTGFSIGDFYMPAAALSLAAAVAGTVGRRPEEKAT